MTRYTGRIASLVLVALAITAGCAKGPADEVDQADGRVAQKPASGGVAQKPASETLIIPAGTIVMASLETRLNTGTNHTGDRFVATMIEPVVVEGKTAVAAGGLMNGVLSNVQDSGRVKGRAQMTLTFQEIVDAAGKVHAVSTQPITLQADSGTGSDAVTIAAGGIIGAVIGGVTGGAKDAAIGSAIGAGAGTVIVLATKGDEIELDPGQKLSVQVTSPASIRMIAQR